MIARLLDRQRFISPRSGGVLLVVLVAIVFMTLGLLTFGELMLTENQAARVTLRQSQARALADSGLELAQRFLTQSPTLQSESGGIYDNAGRFQAQLVYDGGSPRDRGRFSIVAPLIDNGEIDGVRYGFEDESTKLNLNTLSYVDKQTAGSGQTLLMALPGMSEEIADCILDYLDEDDEPRELGAENEYYTALDPPYQVKNGPLETVEELLLVKGVTPELLFGADTNRNGLIDGNEANNPRISDSGDAPPEADRGWSAYVTLYSSESNLAPDGMPRINLNGDDLEKIYDEVSLKLNEQYATFIVAYRQNGPYTGSQAGVSQTTTSLDFTKKAKTKLTSLLDLIGAKTQIPNAAGSANSGSGGGATSGRGNTSGTVLDSPFTRDPGAMAVYLPLLLDNCTTNNALSIPGRININQASGMILAGIPGMDQQLVEAILAARDVNAALDNPQTRYETWLLTQGLVTLDELKLLIPFICGRGCVFRAQVIGYFDQEGPAARIEAVIDTGSNQARLLFWRELTHLGRGYTASQLGAAVD